LTKLVKSAPFVVEITAARFFKINNGTVYNKAKKYTYVCVFDSGGERE